MIHPLLLFFFLFLTWIPLRLQHSSHLSSHTKSPAKSNHHHQDSEVVDEDDKVNLVRFDSTSISPVCIDDRGWLLDPVPLLVILSSTVEQPRVGEIKPGGLRGNYRRDSG